ncbi:MAG TPA: hypothetical protein VEA58_11430 [Anaerovoracaceae bacterium]|nr:hypothetical protein [Anaerovoracaceae bacterium]
MEATHIIKGTPVKFINVKFRIDSSYLEFAVIAILVRNEKLTKKAVREEIEKMLLSGGSGDLDWVSDEEYKNHIDRAKAVSAKLFPTFYNLIDK